MLTVNDVKSDLFIAWPVTVGCLRQNLWGTERHSWRFLRGNALLLQHGEPVQLEGGQEVVYRSDGTLLFYRAGPWREWWREDIQDTLSLIPPPSERLYGVPVVNGAQLLWELDGELRVEYIERPADWAERAERQRRALDAAKERPQAPPRIDKQGARGQHVCPRCSVKAICDAADRLPGGVQ